MFAGIFSMLLQFLGGGIVKDVLAHLDRKVDGETERQRIETQATIEAIKAEMAARAEARTIIIAEQGRLLTSLPRPLFALIFIVYVGKVVVWDKVLALGTTDPLPPYMIELMTMVVTAYFGGRTIEKVASIVTSRRK